MLSMSLIEIKNKYRDDGALDNVLFDFDQAFQVSYLPPNEEVISEADARSNPFNMAVSIEDLEDAEYVPLGLILNRGYKWYSCMLQPFNEICLVSEFSYSSQDSPFITIYTGVVWLDRVAQDKIGHIVRQVIVVPDCAAIVLEYLMALTDEDFECILDRGIKKHKPVLRDGNFVLVTSGRWKTV
jgi:hypothetical protein